jgi:replication initiation protein RepC
LKADRAAESFAALPEGGQIAGAVIGSLKAAAPQLGISPRIVHAVDWLFCFTQPQDWEPGTRPIVWPSTSMQQEALGLSPTQVKEINRRLIELGLVAMWDGPHGKRYGRRHEKTGHYHRSLRLRSCADRDAPRRIRPAGGGGEGGARRPGLGRLRRRATIARKAIAQILETAQEYGFAGEEWITLARETAALVRALRDMERPEEMETGVRSLERRQSAARERLEVLLGVVDSAPKEPQNRPHQYIYNPSLDPDQDTVIAAKDCSGEGEGAGSQSPAAATPGERHGARHPAGRTAAADTQA